MTAHDASNIRDNPALAVPCPWCGVSARRLCRSPTAGMALALHDGRLELHQIYEELKRGGP